MRQTLASAAVLLLAAAVAASASAAAPAAAGLPSPGTLVPGRSLAGIRLGEPASQVVRALGGAYGVCRGCPRTTWYFTYGKFDQHGLAVELTRGRVSAVYTIAQPAGWTAQHGLVLGALSAQVTQVAGAIPSLACPGYSALVLDRHGVRTAYYIVDGKLWGFGLLRSSDSPCR